VEKEKRSDGAHGGKKIVQGGCKSSVKKSERDDRVKGEHMVAKFTGGVASNGLRDTEELEKPSAQAQITSGK